MAARTTPVFRRPSIRIAASLAALVASSLGVSWCRAADAPVDAALADQRRALKQIAIDRLRDGAAAKMARTRAWSQAARASKRAARRGGGLGVRRPPEDLAPAPTGPPSRSPEPPRLDFLFNVRANNPAGDIANACQAEVSIASHGDNVLVMWNDGQGFSTNPAGHTLGYGYSTDGGFTFTDGGSPPTGGAVTRWTGDPVTAVNEKTGEFWMCGMANPTTMTNGLAVVRGVFSGGSITWDTPTIPVSVTNASGTLIDKQWMVADSSSGNLYLSYTIFTGLGGPGSSDSIHFQRRTSGGGWSAPMRLSSDVDAGRVQGSRPVVAGNGAVYVVWSAIDPNTSEDFFRVRRSDDQGVSFGSEVSLPGHNANFGTGAPGFNREIGITYPSITVDRTFGNHRGRVYVAWNESYEHLNDLFPHPGSAVSRMEIETNNWLLGATAFTPGEILRGNTATTLPLDVDYFRCTLAAGQHLAVWADSMPSNQTYTLRLFAPTPDSSQSLAYSGDVVLDGTTAQTYYVFTAPANGSYALRFSPLNNQSFTGQYRIRTLLGTSGTERGRDQRDAFVSWSDDGGTWSTPSRVNSSPVGYDDWLPEVAVAPDGCPCVLWYDWRGDTYGSRSYPNLARSPDAGDNWTGGVQISTAQNNWSAIQSNMVPNQGDYLHLFPDAISLRFAWADGRDGNPDVYTARHAVGHRVTCLSSDIDAAPGDTVLVMFELGTVNFLFGDCLDYAFTDSLSWTLPPPENDICLASDIVLGYEVPLEVPLDAAGDTNRICIRVDNGCGIIKTCCFYLRVEPPPTEVAGQAIAFRLGPVLPHPARGSARIHFALPQSGEVRLELYGVRGDLVRTLVRTSLTAGPQSAVWDGRDDQGRILSSGIYYCRLEAAGRSSSRPIVWMR